MPIPEEVRKKVFVSYSHTDSEWLKRIQIHLKDLTRRGLVDLWDDTKIQSGSQWREEIRGALESAKVAVLLISADFIASDFIAEDELPPLLAAAENDGVVILPLILSPSRFEKIESLSRFQSINPPSKPLIGLPKVEQETYLVKLGDDILRAVEEAQTKPARAGGAKRPHYRHTPKIVVFLSAGGTCRDPMAKAITTKLLEQMKPRPRIEIHAAGLGPSTAEETSYAARYVIREMYGEDLLKDHRPTLLTPDLVARADLILAMDRSLLLTPGKNLPKNKAYVLKEFFGLQGDVVDPWPDGKDPVTLQRYRACAEELKALLTEHIDRIVNVL
jgi:protein-tyrosine-phosphatase